jgi:Class II vitamin B12-dependent ribonucleotide reductase
MDSTRFPLTMGRFFDSLWTTGLRGTISCVYARSAHSLNSLFFPTPSQHDTLPGSNLVSASLFLSFLTHMAQSVTLPDPVANIRRPQETQAEKPSKKGIKIQRRFTTQGLEAYDMVDYELRESRITEPSGKIVFEMTNVEVPKSWSQLATDIIAQKYFRKRGVPGTDHEVSAKQTIHRIAHTIRTFGEDKGYFANKEDAESFEQELKFMLITQRGAFNSPVWFNCGLYHEYQVMGDGGNYAWDFEKGAVMEVDNA